MSRTIKTTVIILILLAAALAGYFYFRRSTPPPRSTPEIVMPKEEGEDTTVTLLEEGEKTAEEVPEGQILMEQSTAAVGSGEPLTFDFTTKIIVTQQGQENISLVEGNIILGKENQGVLQLKNEQIEIKMYSDGDSCVTFLPQDNRYLNMPAVSTRRELIATMMTGILELPAGLLADMLEGKTPESENWSVSSGEHAGNTCWELSSETSEYTLKICLTKEEPYTPLLISIDLKQSALSKYRVPPQTTITIVTELMNWQLWYVLPDDTFAFTPPPDALEIQPEPAMSGTPLREGSQAPEFSLENMDGDTIQLKDYIGKNIIILDFWATWCGPCRQVIPMVAEVAEYFKKEGVILFTVNQRETPEKIKAFLTSQNLSVTVLLDKTGQAGMQYQVTGIPKVIIIGKDGLIKEIYGGMAPNMKELMIERIKSLL